MNQQKKNKDSNEIDDISDLVLTFQKTNNVEIYDNIIVQHIDLVRYLAKKFVKFGESLDDLEQAGYIGLIKAIKSFKVTKNTKFSTYASHCILGEIRHYIRDKTDIIKKPRWLSGLSKKIFTTIDVLSQELGRQPTLKEISAASNITEEGILEILKACDFSNILSLDGEKERENPSQLSIDRIKSQKYVSFQLPIEDQISLMQSIENLKKAEQKIIYQIFYMDLSQTEVAKKMGISQKHVSRLIKKALNNLKILLTKDIM